MGVDKSAEGPEMDRFCFMIPLPTTGWSGCVEFAVRYDYHTKNYK